MLRPKKRFNHIILLSFIILFITLSDSGGYSEDLNQKNITIIFRFDDPSSTSETLVEQGVFAAFQKHRLSSTVGIIPFVCAGARFKPEPQDLCSLSPEKAAILRNAANAGVIEVAQHGYAHQTVREKTFAGLTEFAGLDYRRQLNKIAQGKEYLEKMLGTPITTFIPPWNSYDLNTIMALENLGFKVLSANLRGQAPESASLKFIPMTCELHQLPQAVRIARLIPDAQPIICVLFHEYDFQECGYFEDDRVKKRLGLTDLDEILAWIASQPDIRVQTLKDVAQRKVDLSAGRYHYNKIYNLVYFKPGFWPPHYGVYLPAHFNNPSGVGPKSKQLISLGKIINIISIILLYILIVSISYITGYFFFNIFLRLSLVPEMLVTICIYLYIFVVIFVVMFCYIYVDQIEYKMLSALSCACGTSLGSFHSYSLIKKESSNNNV